MFRDNHNSFDSFDHEFNRSWRRMRYFHALVLGIIAFVAMAIVAVVALRLSGTLPARTRTRAEGLATVYATNVHGWTNPYVQCAGVDSDDNGYVTCMISNRAGASEQIECADQGISDQMNNICRPYRTISIINNTSNPQ